MVDYEDKNMSHASRNKYGLGLNVCIVPVNYVALYDSKLAIAAPTYILAVWFHKRLIPVFQSSLGCWWRETFMFVGYVIAENAVN